MTNDMEYNGWTNRETWALNLWLTNDQGLCEMTRERVAEALKNATVPEGIRVDELRDVHAGEAIKALTGDLFDPEEQLMSPENIIIILSDVGSLYRVNWDEIGEHWLPEDGE
jgi:hypothetical protein